MHKSTEKKRQYRPPKEEPSNRPSSAVSSGIPNSALLSMLEGSSSAQQSSLSDTLESRLLARQPHVAPQIPQAEHEADQLSASITGGTPESVKADLGRQLGADFSGVHFHTGADAVARASAMDARAFTTGSDIYFGQGGFDPSIAAHELVHTVQQGVVDSGVSTLSAPTNQVQMWPWSKKKKSTASGSSEKRGLGRRIIDTVKKPAMEFKQELYDTMKSPAKSIFDWAERRSGHQVDPKETAPLDMDLDNFFEEDLTAPKPKKKWWQKAGGWIKDKASAAWEWGKDKTAGVLTSLKRKNDLAVDQFNTFQDSYKSMPLYKRALWSIRNPIARLTASHRKKGTEKRAAQREAIENAAADYTDNHLKGREQEEARQRRGEVYTPEEEAEYAKLLEEEDTPQELSDEEAEKLLAELEPEAEVWHQNWLKENDTGPALPVLGQQFDDAELEAEYEALLKENDGESQGKEGGLSLEDLEAEVENEGETDPYQSLRDMLASMEQGPTEEDVAAAQANLQRQQQKMDQLMAEADELLSTPDDLEEGEEGRDTKFTLEDGLSLADTITDKLSGDLDDHYEFLKTGGLKGEKMSVLGQGAGFLNSGLGVFTSAKDARAHWKNAKERAAMGDTAGAWSSRFRSVGSGFQGAAAGTNMLQYASPVKFQGMNPVSSGLNAAGNFSNGIADTVDAVAAGERRKRMAASREALENRIASGDKLDQTDELILKMSRQGEGMSKADTVQFGSSAAGNFLKTAGEAAKASGAGAPVGVALNALGTGVETIGGMVAEGQRKDVRSQVVNEEYALQKRVERYMRDHPNVSANEAKQIVLKGYGFRSGKRSEAFGNATIQRIDQVFAADQAGNANAGAFLDALDVPEVNGQRSRNLAGDRLGLRGEGDLEARVAATAASRDFVNPFVTKGNKKKKEKKKKR